MNADQRATVQAIGLHSLIGMTFPAISLAYVLDSPRVLTPLELAAGLEGEPVTPAGYAAAFGLWNYDALLPEEYDRADVARAIAAWAREDLVNWRLHLPTDRFDPR